MSSPNKLCEKLKYSRKLSDNKYYKANKTIIDIRNQTNRQSKQIKKTDKEYERIVQEFNNVIN